MIDTMLLGVLRMPVDDHGDLSLMQLISRAREAADRIERDADRIAELEQWHRDMVAKAAEQSLGGYREMGQRAAKAESERDEAFAKGKQVFEDLRRVEAERDALAAHIEAGREAVEHARQWVPQHVWTRLWLWKEDAPTTSLGRHTRTSQANVLESASPEMETERDRKCLQHLAFALRRQAEEK